MDLGFCWLFPSSYRGFDVRQLQAFTLFEQMALQESRQCAIHPSDHLGT